MKYIKYLLRKGERIMKNIKKTLLFLGAISLVVFGKTNADRLRNNTAESAKKTVVEEKKNRQHLLKAKKVHKK